MIITNKMNLPKAMVDMCTTERHNAEGSYSATTLLKGVKEILLTDRHWEEMSDDVSNRFHAIIGTAVHKTLERESPDTFTEELVDTEIDGTRVTGQIDCYNYKEKCVYDYKTASIWKVQFNDFSDWTSQGMIYAYLLKKCGFEVTKCRFVGMLKDWSRSKARYDSQYPQCPTYVHEFNVTEKDIEETEQKLKDKIKLLIEYNKLPDDEIPECLPKERWAKETKYAAMKQGRKAAVKLFNNKAECEVFVSANGGYVEERKGENTKCLDYCPCREFCNFYRKQEE